MRSSGIVIIYNEETYDARLVNYTTPSQSPGATDRSDNKSKSDSFKLVLIIVLVCVLVPLVLAVFILTLVVVVKVRQFTLFLIVFLTHFSKVLQTRTYRTAGVIIIVLANRGTAAVASLDHFQCKIHYVTDTSVLLK